MQELRRQSPGLRLLFTLGTTTAATLFAVSGLAETSPTSSATDSVASTFDPVSSQRSSPIAAQTSPPILTARDIQSLEPLSTQAQDLSPQATDSSALPTAAANLAQNSAAANTADLNQRERPYSRFYFGSRLPNPTVLPGPTREPVVPASNIVRSGVNIPPGAQYNFGERDRLSVELRGGESVIGAELSYFNGTDNPQRGFDVNVFNLQSYSPAFRGGDRTVRLPDGDKNPIVDRWGGGVEVLRPLLPRLEGAFGISYQSVAVRDGFFSSKLEPFDAQGNKLTVSNSGRDDLLVLAAALQNDTRDNGDDPTRGRRLRFGLAQSLPVGDAAITMTRLSASATQYFPVKFFGFTKGPRTFVLNLQGGHIFGDVPPYEAFSLGGSDTVRGYRQGGVGTGSSFIQATAEYRFPMFGFNFLRRRLDVGGSLFIDYGSVLGTQDDVIGRPGVVRDKPGDGFGGGFGFRFNTGFGVARLDLAVSNEGDFQAYFTVGERF